MGRKSTFTNFDLARFLKSKFKEAIDFRYIKMVGSDINVSGAYKDVSFFIKFKNNNYLMLFTENVTLFDELIPVLREVMNNREPICCYDLVSVDSNYRNEIKTLEWDVVCPYERIRDIVNGRAEGEDSKCLNVSLYGDYKLEHFIENNNVKSEKDFVKIR